MGGIELGGYRQRAAVGNLEYGVGGAPHGRGVSVPLDLQLPFAIDGAESQRIGRRGNNLSRRPDGIEQLRQPHLADLVSGAGNAR